MSAMHPVSNIEEVINDQFQQIFDVMDAKPIYRWKASDKLTFCISQLKQIEIFLASMKFEYADHRGNIEESHEYCEYMLANLEGHQKDIQEGKE